VLSLMNAIHPYNLSGEENCQLWVGKALTTLAMTMLASQGYLLDDEGYEAVNKMPGLGARGSVIDVFGQAINQSQSAMDLNQPTVWSGELTAKTT
jgi:hypothetical protein